MKRLSSFGLLLSMACQFLRMARPNCRAWNRPSFFEKASSDDVGRCLSQGADPNARDKYGVTPLHRAAWKSETPAVVNALLDAGADLSARDKKYGATPLHRAAAFSKTPEVVKVLLDAGADPKARTKDGRTAFDFIEQNYHLKGTDVYWQLNDAHFD